MNLQHGRYQQVCYPMEEDITNVKPKTENVTI